AALSAARPNRGHIALAEMEARSSPGSFTLATQNVDGLHHMAGSRSVLELHGNLRQVRCTECEAVAARGTEALPDLPRCGDCGAFLRPNVVWFHEPLPE